MARCFILSNRLPLSYNLDEKKFHPSSGGLVSAIKGINPSVVDYSFVWLGLVTDDVDEDQLDSLKTSSLSGIQVSPIVVNKKSYDYYYNRYSNNVLWPLFHYERNLVHYSPLGWKAYVEVNKTVADHILKIAQDDDIIWIHDFHFFLVSGYLKEKMPQLKVGFFLHIPFPSSEIFRELPERSEILNSLLKCDLIGFHDLSYLNHFSNSVLRIIGKSLDDFAETKCGVYPISIDSKHFENLCTHQETKNYLEKFLKTKGDKSWILGIDRLDYIKGLLLKLRTFKEFLKKNPKWIGKIQLIQIVIPSRTDVKEYQHLKEKLEQLVSSINGEFSSPSYMPIYYLYHSVSEYELSALYQTSDILYIGSRRDGMNLVCLEYVISQQESSEGQVLLSEFAGAHSTLSYAYSINPWNIEDTCQKLSMALGSSQTSKSFKMKEMKNFLQNYTSSDWAQIFLRDLKWNAYTPTKTLTVSKDHLFQWIDHLKGKKVLIFCDLDGTLAPIASHPSEVKLQERTKSILENLKNSPLIDFIVVSGRDKKFLNEEFIKEKLNLNLAACHGSLVYHRDTKKWTDLTPDENKKWKDIVREILNLYTIRTPHSFIEDKEHAIVWHYRNSPSSFSDFLSNKLMIELEAVLSSFPVQVARGKKIIEVKSIYANKGQFVKYWLSQIDNMSKPDIIIALGDDSTDEDMFRAIKEQNDINSYCIKIGDGQTAADYFVEDQSVVNSLIEKIVDTTQLNH